MASEPKTIVVVDDEPQVRAMLESYLAREGFVASGAGSGEMMQQILSRTPADLVILDVILPGEDGFEIARRLRRTHPDIGIIMLTAKGDEIDRVVGLEVGADDYIAKPFSLREVLARVKSVLRRAPRSTASRPSPTGIVAFDQWRLDLDRRRLSSTTGEDLPLSPGEFALLRAFVEHAGRVLSRDTLIELTRGYGADALDRAIDVQVTRLRHKIEVNPRAPQIIKTVRGGGYTFAAAVSVS
jgi:DNA-binding response OmpR family regulator